jgi:hypothetical protein
MNQELLIVFAMVAALGLVIITMTEAEAGDSSQKQQQKCSGLGTTCLQGGQITN